MRIFLQNGARIDIGHYIVNRTILSLISPILFSIGLFLALYFRKFFPGVVFESSWVNFTAALLFVEFVAYWRHRLFHSPYMWKFHAIHHSSVSVNWLSSKRMHFVNVIINRIGDFCLLMAIGMPLVDNGKILLFREIFTTISHCDIRFSFGWLRFLFVTPQLHRLHHARVPEFETHNFGFVFSFFDIIFGTFKDPALEICDFGTNEPVSHSSLRLQLLYPFSHKFWLRIENKNAIV